jgi:hypothetical protein
MEARPAQCEVFRNYFSQRHRAQGEHKGKTKISGLSLCPRTEGTMCLGVSVRSI